MLYSHVVYVVWSEEARERLEKNQHQSLCGVWEGEGQHSAGKTQTGLICVNVLSFDRHHNIIIRIIIIRYVYALYGWWLLMIAADWQSWLCCSNIRSYAAVSSTQHAYGMAVCLHGQASLPFVTLPPSPLPPLPFSSHEKWSQQPQGVCMVPQEPIHVHNMIGKHGLQGWLNFSLLRCSYNNIQYYAQWTGILKFKDGQLAMQ